MVNLVHITGSFSIDKLKEILSEVEVLANQPRFNVHAVYADKNPQFSYRHIFVSRGTNNKLEYHAMDIGRVKGEYAETSIGDKIYSEEDIEKLK